MALQELGFDQRLNSWIEGIGSRWFVSSFDRPNIRYSVTWKKGKHCFEQITAIITTEFTNTRGIVFCLSRHECDEYAAYFRRQGLEATSYHAGLTDSVRRIRQGKWMSDEVDVICATIAFGMGIDKPDVRFVIHATLPKSIEGYYQESGRAGRDGQVADSVVFYRYADTHRIRRMIESDSRHPRVVDTHVQNLFKMVAFCENITDCRRWLQLDYLGEAYDRRRCRSTIAYACDTCRCEDEITTLDVTEVARDIVRAVRVINDRRSRKLTMVFLTEIFKGSDIRKIKDSGLYLHSLYGRGKSWTRMDVERLMHHLVLRQYLQEDMYINNEIACAYVDTGPEANLLLTTRDVKVLLPMRRWNDCTRGVTVVSTVTNRVVKDLQDRCYAELMTVITEIAGAFDVSASSILNMTAVRCLSQRLPQTEEAMLRIPYVTKAIFQLYGKTLLKITQRYATEENVSSNKNDVTRDDTYSRDSPSTSNTRSRKRNMSDNFNSTCSEKYKRGSSSRVWRGKGSSSSPPPPPPSPSPSPSPSPPPLPLPLPPHRAERTASGKSSAWNFQA